MEEKKHGSQARHSLRIRTRFGDMSANGIAGIVGAVAVSIALTALGVIMLLR
jgi:hypothetical protein